MPLPLQFVASATDHTTLADLGPEIAVAGRSNVGKSSLINALANRKNLAHVSKTPGRTQTLNQFEVGEIGALVDLPGYGYAAVPGRVTATWPKMIEGYLLEREQLVAILVLVDGEIGPTKLDLTMLAWVRSYERPYYVVATKADKVKSSVKARRRKDLAEQCRVKRAWWVSSAKGTGIEELQGLAHRLLTGTEALDAPEGVE